VDSLPVLKEDNTKVSVPCLGYLGPPPDPSISLYVLPDRVGYRILDPFHTNGLAVVPISHMQKVLCEFHIFTNASMRWNRLPCQGPLPLAGFPPPLLSDIERTEGSKKAGLAGIF